jgi:predicted  nucleic acid-binding Zn-ribbon protein
MFQIQKSLRKNVDRNMSRHSQASRKLTARLRTSKNSTTSAAGMSSRSSTFDILQKKRMRDFTSSCQITSALDVELLSGYDRITRNAVAKTDGKDDHTVVDGEINEDHE